MSSPIDHLAVLHNNPFIFAPVLENFFNTYGTKRCGILLSYIVLPLVLPEESRKFLVRARSTSSIRTLRKNRKLIHGLAERVGQYRALTNLTVQYLIDSDALLIDKNMAVAMKRTHICSFSPSIDTQLAAEAFAKLCLPYDVPTVYRMLGVNSL